MKSATFILTTAALVSSTLLSARAESYSLTSPDGHTEMKLECSENRLTYSISRRDRALIDPSLVSLMKDPAYSVVGVETDDIDQKWKPVWGQFSELRDHCRQFTLKLKSAGLRMDLVCRVYDDGVGLRWSVPAQPDLGGRKLDCLFEYKAAEDFATYTTAGEREPVGPVAISMLAGDKPSFRVSPLVMDTGKGTWLALLESDLFSAKLFGSAKFAVSPGSPLIKDSARVTASDQGFVTPWKVITWGGSPGDLLVNCVPLHLAAPDELTKSAWVKPGKGLWDWRNHGYDNGSFKYGIDTRSYLHLIDFAAAQGFEYLTIDDHWFTVPSKGVIKAVPEVDMAGVMRHAREKGVGIILYYDRLKGDAGDDAVFKTYRELGAAGVKYGFMGNKAAFTREAITTAAENELLIFFHDGPTPMTGVERTFPNMITREYCHAQQDSRRAFTPTAFIKMAMINALTGPLDQANGNFGIKGINAGERKKGPRQKGSYLSTVVSEVARVLVIHSGLITLPDAPEEYLKKADLFEFIKQMPATWDETRVINSSMGEYITTARRSGDSWFVGSVNNEAAARELPIPLNFLEPGKNYRATLYQDVDETDCVRNPEAYELVTKPVSAGDTITARMARGGGHAMILRPELP